MNNQQFEELWRQRLADQAASGMSIAQWCHSQGMRTDRFYHWRRRLAADLGQATAKTQTQTWVAVEVDQPAAISPAAGVSVRIGCATIELQTGFDPATLRAVLQVLEAPRC